MSFESGSLKSSQSTLPVNEQVEISLFCAGHLIGWI